MKKSVKSIRVVFAVSGDMYCPVASSIGMTAGQSAGGMLAFSKELCLETM
jgi:hypothetical protein